MRKSTKQTRATTAPAKRQTLKASSATEASKKKTDRPTAESAPKPAERSEELRFKVTESFRQQFKQTAKELGLKKSALLEKLLADWHARQTALAHRSSGVASTEVSPTKQRSAKNGR